MLVNLNDVLRPARAGKYGVGLFNAVNLEMAKGVLQAAEENRCPVIIGTAEVLLNTATLEETADMLLPMAKRASVPVVLHFDHGLTHDLCVKALELGFTSVMYDCSTDTYEDNLKKVKEMADIAHSYGATLEAELGHVGEAAGHDPSAFYTDPAQALEFVQHTGCDALAIAVGTAHGAYKFPPKLDFARIETIAAQMDTPLVLHGGSGAGEENIRKAFRLGIKTAPGSDAGAYRVLHGKGIRDEVQSFAEILGDQDAAYRWLAEGEAEIKKKFTVTVHW